METRADRTPGLSWTGIFAGTVLTLALMLMGVLAGAALLDAGIFRGAESWITAAGLGIFVAFFLGAVVSTKFAGRATFGGRSLQSISSWALSSLALASIAGVLLFSGISTIATEALSQTGNLLTTGGLQAALQEAQPRVESKFDLGKGKINSRIVAEDPTSKNLDDRIEKMGKRVKQAAGRAPVRRAVRDAKEIVSSTVSDAAQYALLAFALAFLASLGGAAAMSSARLRRR